MIKVTKKSNDNKDGKGDNEQTQQPNTSRTATNTVTSNNKVVLMPTATVAVNSKQNDYNRVKCRLLFDSGSQRTYVSKTLVDAIDAETIRTEYLAVRTFGTSTTGCLPRDIVSITVSDRTDQESIEIEPIVVEKICNPIQSHELDIAESAKMRFNEFDLADTYHTDDEILIEILIGLDYYWSIAMGGVIKTSSGPVAIASKFGYILSGPIEDRKFSNVTTSTCATRAPPITKSMTNVITIDLKLDEITKSLNKFWDTESLGVVKEEYLKPNEVRIRLNGIRYEVELPWKEKYPDISDNYILAKRRLYSQIKRLQKDPEILDKYNQIMKEQQEAGIIEEVPEYNISTAGKNYYMSHQLVVREDRVTTKLRIVYDASSKLHRKSLNESLENIPTKHTDLFSVLLQFRAYKVALTADIEKAFLR